MLARRPQRWFALGGALVCALSVCLARAQIIEVIVDPWAELARTAQPSTTTLQDVLPEAATLSRVAATQASTQVAPRVTPIVSKSYDIPVVPMVRAVPSWNSAPDATPTEAIVDPWADGTPARPVRNPEIVDPWSEQPQLPAALPKVPTAAFAPLN